MPSPSLSSAPSGMPSPLLSFVHACLLVRASTMLRTPSPSKSSSPSDRPSLFESPAFGFERVWNSAAFGTPSPSVSPRPSAASGSRPLRRSHASGMPSPSLSADSTGTNPGSSKPLTERPLRSPLPTRTRLRAPSPPPPWRGAGAETSVDSPTSPASPASPPVTGTALAGPPGSGAPSRPVASLRPFGERRSVRAVVTLPAGAASVTASLSPPGVSPVGQSDQPRSGALKAPMPSTPATSPAATVPANRRSRTVPGRSVRRASRLMFVRLI
jgi:hypothetical protein